MKVPSSKQIITKRLSINEKIDNLEKELEKLQKGCPHHNLRYKYDGSSGGYDYDASYWIDWFCPDCNYRWETYQGYQIEKETLKKYPKAKKIDKYDSPREYENFFEQE